MNAVLLNAGGPNEFFPIKMVKCLCHFKIFSPTQIEWIAILGHQVRLLREIGIKDIRVVTGYKKEKIENVNDKYKLGLELVYNNQWEDEYSKLKSIKVGIKGLDDDILLILGDVILNMEDLKVVLESEPFAVVKGYGEWGHAVPVGKEEGIPHMFKIPCKFFKKISEMKEWYLDEKKIKRTAGFTNFGEFCMDNGAVEILTKLWDLDFFNMTGEFCNLKRGDLVPAGCIWNNYEKPFYKYQALVDHYLQTHKKLIELDEL